jgi:hypothetical protein
LEASIGKDGLEFTLARTDRVDASSEQTASALLTVHLKDADARRAGRAFSQAAVELALASYPGCALTGPPGDATPFGVFTAASLPQSAVEHVAVLPDGTRVPIEPPRDRTQPPPEPIRAGAPHEASPRSSGTRKMVLGSVIGARSGDKGGDANIGVWARSAAGHAWLREFLTVDRLKALLPETAGLRVERHELANLRALNFIVYGLLGAGVAASTRFDPQGKALGEWLRSRLVDVPEVLL